MENRWNYPFEDQSSWQRAEYLAEQASELYEQGQMEQALACLQEAMGLGAENPVWYFNIALILDAIERYEEAVDYYLKALEELGEDVEILNCLAVDYTRTAQYDLALAIFEHIQKIDPDFEPCYCNRIITYTEMEQFDKAEEMFYLAQQIEPDCPLCFYNIGNALFSQGLFEKAIWCWHRTAELDPNHPQIYYRLAQAYWCYGQYEKAQESFLTELRDNPDDPEVLLDYGIFLLERGDLLAARNKLTQFLEQHAENATVYFYLGECCRLSGDLSQAAQYYQTAIQADPNVPGVRFRLAEMLIDQQHYTQAQSLLAQELTLEIDDVDVLLAIGWMLLACQDVHSGTQVFLDILDKQQQDSRIFLALGVSMAAKSEFNFARQCVEHALELDSNNPIALLYAAWTCCLMEDWPAAGKYVQQYKRLGQVLPDFQAAFRQMEKQIRWGRFTTRLIK